MNPIPSQLQEYEQQLLADIEQHGEEERNKIMHRLFCRVSLYINGPIMVLSLLSPYVWLDWYWRHHYDFPTPGVFFGTVFFGAIVLVLVMTVINVCLTRWWWTIKYATKHQKSIDQAKHDVHLCITNQYEKTQVGECAVAPEPPTQPSAFQH